ncbi:MAG TPA: NAD-binding protein [Polyangium sp.]|nr:NAD-binding protein [Polyangium sp.]
MKRIWIRLAVVVRQNAAALLFVAVWIVVNFTVFRIVFDAAIADAMLLALCVQKNPSAWGRFYATFTEVIVFGVIASMIVANVSRRYRPEATCAALAERARNHIVVIGYTNLGKRIRALADDAGATAVVVDEDRALVDDLVRTEAPLVLGSARDESTLEHAQIEYAKVVVVATDDLETAVVACRLIRAKNPKGKLVVRCADDDVGQILGKSYAARVLSTSKVAAKFILAKAQKAGVRKAVIIGKNNLGKRLAESLRAEAIGSELLEETEDVNVLRQAGVETTDLVVIADDDLGKNLVRVDRIRDLNTHCLVVCRVFHDDAAEILTQNPFRCVILSTSRLAAEQLVEEGIFREMGIVGPKKKSRG